MIGGLCGGASIWTMVFIALDRYNVIVKVNHIRTINNVFLTIIIIKNNTIADFRTIGYVRQTIDHREGAYGNSVDMDVCCSLGNDANDRMEQVRLWWLGKYFLFD